jgi:hypothetical protein
MNRRKVAVVMACAGLVLLCVIARLLPHPPNFGPVASAALMAGCLIQMRRRWLGLLLAALVPLAAMAISDIWIGSHAWQVMIAVYASLALPVLLAPLIEGRMAAVRIGGCAVFCSLFFFVVTNFAVWGFGGIYSQTASGLVTCYAAALPFLKYTLAGDLFWSAVLFGGYALMTRMGRSTWFEDLEWRLARPRLQPVRTRR